MYCQYFLTKLIVLFKENNKCNLIYCSTSPRTNIGHFPNKNKQWPKSGNEYNAMNKSITRKGIVSF